MAKKRKRRTHTAHPGVKLKKLTGAKGDRWVARFRDPDTGRETQWSLNALDKTTDEARRMWAIEKSQSLRAHKAAVKAGAIVRTENLLADAVKLYTEHRKNEVSKATLKAYTDAAKDFTAWAGTRSLNLTESITPAHLLDYRTSFLSRPKHAQAKGQRIGRGKRRPVKVKRAPVTVNKALRSLKTILNYWRARGITPNLSGDSIRDSLKPVRGLKTSPDFLKATQCRALVEAAMNHDAATFVLTRAEHDGKAAPGTTPRYTPIAPLIVAGLLTGCRWHELAEMRWDSIDLEAGLISLEAAHTKTRQSRRITLAETPALAALLAALKLRAGNNRYLWGREPFRHDLAESTRKRLVRDFGAPAFTWLDLRHTCGTFLTCAPAIYGAASAFLSAKRLGHSVVVSEKHYAGAVTVAPEIKTLEAALKIDDLCAKIVAGLSGDATEGRLLQMSA